MGAGHTAGAGYLCANVHGRAAGAPGGGIRRQPIPSRTNAGSRPPRIASWYFKPAHANDDRIAFTNTTIRARGGPLSCLLTRPSPSPVNRSGL